MEKRIEDGAFDQAALDDALLLRFHGLICGDLVPKLAGWRRTNVTVGEHEPPDFFKVPALVREYGLDLQARVSAAGEAGEILLETLAFAEGRLLFIHPFADFNGRVTRVWLRESCGGSIFRPFSSRRTRSRCGTNIWPPCVPPTAAIGGR